MGEFLADFKEEFSREDKEVNKIAELKRLEQESKMIEEFLQKFKRVARESEYKEQLLIEDFKYGINSTIKQRLMKSEYQPELINQ